MNREYKISVIVPVYNEEKNLKECLDSILSQSLKEAEIICVDDGSTDNSVYILNRYAKEFNNIAVIQQQNQGSGKARNMGIDIAKGKYIAFLDSDDKYPDKDVLRDLYEACENHQADISGGSMSYMNSDGIPYASVLDEKNNKQIFEREGLYQYSDYQFDYGYYRFIFRAELLKKNNIRFPLYRRFQDPPFFIKAMISAGSFYALTRPTYMYRKGHREVTWTEVKAADLLGGLLDDLTMAVDSGLDDLANLTLSRVVVDYADIIRDKLYAGSEMVKARVDQIKEICRNNEGFGKYLFALNRLCTDETFAEIVRRKEAGNDSDNPVKVSVIMPSLNVAPYIRECIESAINQTMKDIQIICVDAGSTDGTLEILKEYAEKDSRIQIINSPVKSYGYQMNLGLQAATGDFFAILETDDWIKPLMLEELYELAQSNYLDFVKSDRSSFVGDGFEREFTYLAAFGPMELRKNYWKVLNPQEDRVAFKAHNLTQTGLYRLAFVKDNHINYHETPGASYQDNGFWFLSMCHAKRIMIIEKDYYMLRRDNPNSSVNSLEKVYCICEEYDYIRSKLAEEPELEEKFKGLCAYHRFKNYEWTYGRIRDDFKDEYLERFAHDFQKLMDAGEIDAELYDMEESYRLHMLKENPISYKYHRNALDNPERTAYYSPMPQSESINAAEERLRAVAYDLDCVHNSVSFRIGRLLTWLPRKIRGGIRCLRDNGLIYTINRIKIHLGINNDIVFNDHAVQIPVTINRNYDFYDELNRFCYRTEILHWFTSKKLIPLDLDYPRTFNEKMQWMKLYGNSLDKTQKSDTLFFRKLASEMIGQERIQPVSGTWKSFEDIDYNELPDSFVLRANNGRNRLIKVNKSSDLSYEKLTAETEKWKKENPGLLNGLELYRLNVITQFFTEDTAFEETNKPSFYCFDGKCQLIAYEKDGGRIIFDDDWAIKENDGALNADLFKKPVRYAEMAKTAEKLTAGYEFAIINFAVKEDGSFFADSMDFMPKEGYINWINEADNDYYGSLITLPVKNSLPVKRI